MSQSSRDGKYTECDVTECLLKHAQVDGPVLVDDTSLCFNALGGLPGPYMYVMTNVSSRTAADEYLEANGSCRILATRA